jgi:hypothetical protein
MAMENTFKSWSATVNPESFRVKIVTQQRTADARYENWQVGDKMEQSILRIVQKSWVGSITLTAPCGCSYIFEKTEHHADHICGTHWVHMVFDGVIDE